MLAIHFAVAHGDINALSIFLQAGENVDVIFIYPHCTIKWTPLMYAVVHGQKECARLLLEAGANVHLLTLHGCNALSLACTEGAGINKQACAVLLLEYGAVPPANYTNSIIQQNIQTAQSTFQHLCTESWSRSNFCTWPAPARCWVFLLLLAHRRAAVQLPGEVWDNYILPHLTRGDYIPR